MCPAGPHRAPRIRGRGPRSPLRSDPVLHARSAQPHFLTCSFPLAEEGCPLIECNSTSLPLSQGQIVCQMIARHSAIA